jgi:hypothetical protein
MPFSSYGHSADYTYIDGALRAHWIPCQTLASEMAAFVPKSKSEFQPQWDAEIQRLQLLNPDTPVEQLADLVESQIAVIS